MALGQYNSTPSRAHLLCAKGVLRYLAGTVSLCLQFPSPSPVTLPDLSPLPSTCGFSNADWASDEKDRKSISGYCFFFLDSLVSWSSRKQQIVSTSSTESEYYALTNAIKEAIWIKLFLTLTKLPTPQPFPVLLDAPMIPAGMTGIRRNPLESTGMRQESGGIQRNKTGIGQESAGMEQESAGITVFLIE